MFIITNRIRNLKSSSITIVGTMMENWKLLRSKIIIFIVSVSMKRTYALNNYFRFLINE